MRTCRRGLTCRGRPRCGDRILGETAGGQGVAEPVVVDVGAAKAFDGDAAEVTAGFHEEDGAAHFAGLNGGGNAGGGDADCRGIVNADIALAGMGGEGEEPLAAVHSVCAVTWARRLATPAV